MTTQNFNLNKTAYSVNEFLSLVPIGRTSLYAAIKNGSLRATKFGKKTIILAPNAVAFLESLPTIPKNIKGGVA